MDRVKAVIMNILLLGSGGREHALACKSAASPLTDQLYCAPGNAGIARDAECIVLDVDDHAAVIAFCKSHDVDFVMVGPEGPLCAGIVDDLEAAGIKAFGPSRSAAQLEGSKGFTKDLCRANAIPTASYGRFREAEPAKDYVRAHGAPIVVKADGLAAGKGVIVAENIDEDEAAIALASAQDHKRAFDGDKGPNTGGMGAYSPAPIVDDAMAQRVMSEIISPTLRAMRAMNAPYKGILYAGLMITAQGP